MSLFDFMKKDSEKSEQKEEKIGLISDQFGVSEKRADEIIKEVMTAILVDPSVRHVGDLIKFVRNKYIGDEREYALFIAARAAETVKNRMAMKT